MKTSPLSKIILFAVFVLAVTACSKDDGPTDPNPGDGTFTLGWGNDENLTNVPVTTNFSFSNSNLPSAYDMDKFFPPIGDQGQYGTCVSWAAGYNLKTALSGIQRGLSKSDLSASINQYSPKDLFWAIPNNQKGANCNGTQFEYALDVLQNRGIATMNTVPYTNLGDCSSQPQSAWTSEAGNYKIKYWRKIDPTVASIKQNVANNVPVVIGAYLSDNFMQWRSDDVMSSNTTYDQVGIHAGHALIVSGYDDNKGPNGAFRVINSWGTSWGDRGYIWIDYNFFINEFVPDFGGYKPLYIAANQDGDVTPPNPDVNPPTSSGVDMAPWIFADYSTYQQSGDPTERNVDFNLYNIGSKAARASDDWSVYYIYFNAYNANDYGVLFYDQFNTSIPQNTYDCPSNYNCIFNLDIPGNSDFAAEAFGTEWLYRTYNMPDITGQYYLVMLADGEDRFAENDEQNNLFYTSIDPMYFQNGYGLKEGQPKMPDFKNEAAFDPSNKTFTDVKTKSFRNAYTVEEVKQFFKKEINSSRFLEKIGQVPTSDRGKANYKNTSSNK